MAAALPQKATAMCFKMPNQIDAFHAVLWLRRSAARE